ncbi:glycoside hydrolase family 3 protein [Hydnomerulius pinastri MD-312]|nr:glycoside hydrolase family 3 protein [Hydnomerulius pinastri MD-312]
MPRMDLHPFLTASIPEVISQLDLEEKISLLSAPDSASWSTYPIRRLDIPGIRMRDGPNGVRGSPNPLPAPAICLPCGTAMGSTFDIELLRQVGEFLAEESKTKSSLILLAPTCNTQRNPMGGRSFESFSEDPHLSGTITAAYVNGLQSRGVSATIKHFVANDQESERRAANSVVSDRALREIYLYPFMLAQKFSKPWAYMTSYGRVWGTHCSENPKLLTDVLRNEWGHDGLIMSDWRGTYSTDLSLKAGLDLEMPGPPIWRTPLLVQTGLTAQKLYLSDIDARVAKLLTYVQKLANESPDIAYSKGIEEVRESTPEMKAFCRKVAADSMVLLKNEGQVLPITYAKVKTIAVIGPHAKSAVISGGGAAALVPTYVVTPYEGILANLPQGVKVKYALGCYAHRFLPTMGNYMKTRDGKPGWRCTFYTLDSHGNLDQAVADYILNNTELALTSFKPRSLPSTWSAQVEGLLTVDETALYEIGLMVSGRAKLYVDGRLVIDNWTHQTLGEYIPTLGQGTTEVKEIVALSAGQSVNVLIEYTNTLPQNKAGVYKMATLSYVRFGGTMKVDPRQAIANAVDLAKKSDVVVYIGGLTPEWESEWFDRTTLTMPGLQDELIAKLGQANPNTVVCIQAGSAVSMPWVDDVNGILQAWYSGNELGNALSDILFGTVNPSGRLSLTLPVKEQDIPAYPNLRSENGQIHYREDLFVGYKSYLLKNIKPLFPFGFGLSYTTFAFSELSISPVSIQDSDLRVKVKFRVINTGTVPGSSVAQLYITLPDIGLATPALQLKGFAKAKDLGSGASEEVEISLDKYAVSFWDATTNSWCAHAGEYVVHVGSSSADMHLRGSFQLKNTFNWTGL